MRIESFQYNQEQGWSVDALPVMSEHAQQLVLVFGAPDMRAHPAPFERLRQSYPGAHLVGCSTAGEILHDMVHDHSLTVTVIGFEHARLKLETITLDEHADAHQAGSQLARALQGEELVGVYVLSDGLHVNGSELARGLSEVLGDALPVTGGLAADGSDFGATWVLAGAQLGEHLIAAVGFYGEGLSFTHGSRGGWDPFGPTRQVTRSSGNILYEIDGQPALEIYKRYLGERADELPGSGLLFPLALREDPEDEDYLVRTILAVDEQESSLTFAGDIAQGAYAQLMKANFERLVDGAEQAAHMTGEHAGPALVLAVSCVGRRLVMGQRIEEELEATLSHYPEGTHQTGFYSYGELSPKSALDGSCALHNQTMTLTVIRED